jgi:hypothetical protein
MIPYTEKSFIDQWKKNKPASIPEHPNHCDLCGTGIGKEDPYYVGKDRHGIWARTCTDPKCTKWLKYKGIVKRIL